MSIHGGRFGEMNGLGAQVDKREDQDGVVTAQPTVGDDGTDEGHGVDPESVESTDRKGFLLTHAKSTGDTVGAMSLGDGPSSRARGQFGTNVVVVDVGGTYWWRCQSQRTIVIENRGDGATRTLTVVGETLSKLDDDDQEGGERKGIGDVTESIEFCVGDILGAFDESSGGGLVGGRAIDFEFLLKRSGVSHGEFVSVGRIGGHCRGGLPGDRECEMGAPGGMGNRGWGDFILIR